MAMDFKLSDEFVDSYRDKEPPFGYRDGAGNALGEISYLRTYSRKMADGSKETWADTVRRVIEGMFTIQKRHCRQNHIEWKNDKAQRTAKDAYDRMFHMKWLPAGRGLWAMGSPIVMEDGNSAPLQSCAFISSDESVTEAMTFLFDASMLGVGVGFDADGADKFQVHEPVPAEEPYIIPDSREGWVESLRILLDAYLDPTRHKLPEFDYSLIRPEGSPIKKFGGVASGPAPLRRMHEAINLILKNAVGRTLSMRDIADIGNIIGTCVVSGNVRRCLPEGTKVHTTSGLVNIEDIKIGDTVEVAGKTAKVSNFFDQGVQETVIVKYDGGQIECTPNHRLAVFDTLTSWTFKRADELTTDDRLVWDRHGITGVSNNQMPAHNHVKRSSDTTGQDIVIPDLDTDSAWLIGLIHGDGYVFMPSGKTPNGHIMIASAPDTPEVLAKAQEQLERYGVRVRNQPPREDDKAIRVYANSSQLADYMHKNVKQANTSITIPDWIKTSPQEIRAAYLAGLMDADGSYKTRPLQAIVTIYPEFASQVVDLYTSLGIQVRSKMCRPAIGNWKALYTVDIVGGHNIRAFEEMISQYSMKRGDDVRPSRSRGGATFSTSMVREAGIKGPHVFNPPANRQNAERVEKVLGATLPALPYQVLEVVPSGRRVQTYDIEVEDIHQFTANGLVVHNSAEILFVDYESENLDEFLDLKNYEKNPDRAGHGWMSNNSVRANVGDDLTPLMEGIKLNGEPGVVWMDVTRNFGRLKDGADYKDVRVKGYNPCVEQPLESGETCVSGDTMIQTSEGLVPIKDRVGEITKIWNGEKWSPVLPFYTGKAPLYRVRLSDGSYLDATPSHFWDVKTKTGAKFNKLRTSELVPGMRLNKFSLERPVEESDEVDPLAYSYGWVAGDGFVDGNKVMGIVQTAHADKVMPNLAVKAIYPQQNFSHGSPKTYNRVVLDIPIEDGRILRAGSTLPERVLSFNQASLREFFSAWLDTDGTVSRQRGSDNYRIYGSEGQIRLGQMLLRRLGINHASVKVAGRKGDVTNMGVRNKDLYYLNIPSYESTLLDSTLKKVEKIGSRFKKNNAYAESNTVDSARVQKVVSVEKISDEEDTYCFSEHERGMGVFGNVLTYQCVLVETFVNNCTDREDFIKTLKVAYLYGKTVTLLPTKWERTNTVMQRNRRIGLSASGVADFVDNHGMAHLREMLDDGFNYVLKTDRKYSEWLCVRESIRHTTMKPSGTISILAGSSPGTHWTPGGEYFIRRITFAKTDPLFTKLKEAGYEHSDLEHDPNSAVILFPVHSQSKRASSDVPAWEKIHLAAEIQHWWSDNAVSCTVDFSPEEAGDIPTLLSMYDGKIKGISFLPSIEGGAYKNMPYEKITAEKFKEMTKGLQRIDFGVSYSEGKDAVGEKYCATDMCEITEELNADEDLVAVPMVDLLKV